ncbi:N-acetyl sugar amidotransferase [Larkinella knui]|uniref:N-acetyl sugar amidotransferase n=1 Tax=Larkinella knui TaxID=2025310 RepID=A0A3P1CI36_9BACT|nr:N-acetyl sugar amidotransferase [Larkinella knui]RRB12920.1 N-acetyl sugar amidotransferase [Larkinella knui]
MTTVPKVFFAKWKKREFEKRSVFGRAQRKVKHASGKEVRTAYLNVPNKPDYRRCSRCVLDTTVSDIWFDAAGVCKYCQIHDEMERLHPLENMEEDLGRIVERIKKAGRNNTYDCIVGVSGGRDSIYTLYLARKLGLRPLAVYFDNGWNTDVAVSNIRKATDLLRVDLHTVMADLDEFKDLQRAFLKASVPDADIPTVYAIHSVLYEMAAKEGIGYILNGHSFRTEGTSPISWTYMDGRYIKDVHRKFGSGVVRSFKIMMLPYLLYYSFVKRIREVRLLEYIDYNKKKVDEILARDLGWAYYGGYHHKNLYTKFFQSFLLPNKFNIDKRKTELSALVRSGQMTRAEAIAELEAGSYKYDRSVVIYAISKLGWTLEEWETVYFRPPRSHRDFKTYLPLIRFLRLPIWLACKLRILPYILYLKYAS